MVTSSKDPRSVEISGAYVGRDVDTGGGDFVGGDQFKTVYQQRGSASIEDLLRLLAEVRALLPQADLEPDLAEVIEGDFRVVEDQAKKDRPKGGLIKAKLKGILEVIQESGKTSEAIEKMLRLVAKGVTLVGALF